MPDNIHLAAVYRTLGILTSQSAPGAHDQPRFDAEKLARLSTALGKIGIDIIIADKDGEKYLDAVDAEAAYIVETDGGSILLREGATRIAVVEELIHLGQHRRLGFDEEGTEEFLKRRIELEVQAQNQLLELAESRGWSTEERESITMAREKWKKLSPA